MTGWSRTIVNRLTAWEGRQLDGLTLMEPITPDTQTNSSMTEKATPFRVIKDTNKPVPQTFSEIMVRTSSGNESFVQWAEPLSPWLGHLDFQERFSELCNVRPVIRDGDRKHEDAINPRNETRGSRPGRIPRGESKEWTIISIYCVAIMKEVRQRNWNVMSPTLISHGSRTVKTGCLYFMGLFLYLRNI